VNKKPKKLALNRETLLSLDPNNLKQAAGGASVACTYTNCCSGQATCASCGATCGTRLC
jgi:hypothetical protein